MARYPLAKAEVEAFLQDQGEDFCLFMRYLYGHMPAQDVLSAEVSTLAGFARATLDAAEKLDYVNNIPPEIFFPYVLHHRVNSECLEDCRGYLLEQLLPYVAGKTMEQAALAVNYWCYAHATYTPADDRTLGPLAVLRRTLGRCGEESVLAKCSADSARHRLRRRNANECFGCCGPAASQWAMTPGDMKWYMDYLFLRGVNLLYPHAFYYSIRDGRGDERPPDAGPNNAWWPESPTIAAYMRRLSWLMTDSVNQARVAVLCEGDRMPW